MGLKYDLNQIQKTYRLKSYPNEQLFNFQQMTEAVASLDQNLAQFIRAMEQLEQLTQILAQTVRDLNVSIRQLESAERRPYQIETMFRDNHTEFSQYQNQANQMEEIPDSVPKKQIQVTRKGIHFQTMLLDQFPAKQELIFDLTEYNIEKNPIQHQMGSKDVNGQIQNPHIHIFWEINTINKFLQELQGT